MFLSIELSAFAWERYPVPPINYTGSSTFNSYSCHTYTATVNKSEITVEWDEVAYVNGYEVVLYNVERNIRTALGIVMAAEIKFKLPNRTGHYVVEVRSVRYFNDATKTSIRAMTKTQLLTFIESNQVDFIPTPDMLDTQIAEAIIAKGSSSQWSITSDINIATVSGVKKCWWIIGKPAAPGAININ